MNAPASIATKKRALTAVKPYLTSFLAVVTMALCGCGGSGGSSSVANPPTVVNGVALDGYLQNAVVFYDLNDDGLLQSNEPSATTDASGHFVLSINAADVGKHRVILIAKAGRTIDSDNPGGPITAGFVLSSTLDHPEVVSPLTSAVAVIMAANPGLTSAAAEAQVKARFGLTGTTSLFTDFANRVPGNADLVPFANLAKLIRAEIQAFQAKSPNDSANTIIAAAINSLFLQIAEGFIDLTKVNITTTVDASVIQGLVTSAITQSGTYPVGGQVSGLSGTVVLQNNNGDNLTLSANGAFTFNSVVAYNKTYSVTVVSQPAGQTCSISGAQGNVWAAVTNVVVTCSSSTFRIGGNISGLIGSVTLQNNGGDSLTVTANGAIAFATAVAYGGQYNVRVLTQPPGQTCSVTTGSGTTVNNVTNVAVVCSTNAYAVGGTVSGLAGMLTLQDNGADNMVISANGPFTFPSTVANGARFGVSVFAQPIGQTCTVSGGSGVIAASNVTGVAVSCTNNPISACGSGLLSCNNACVNPSNDPNNCSACGVVCSSGVCSGSSCQAPSCSDGIKNGAETSVDCGGGSCAACGSGKGCNTGTDCASGSCVGHVCQAATCSDQVKNGAETDVDCGGGTCAACSSGKACAQGSDCASRVCAGNVCQAPVCSDGVKNGTETDVDCGGSTCGACAIGKACSAGTDCSSGVCTGNVCQAAPTCTDGMKNGAETDVDCGGPTCAKCAVMKGCAIPSDCTSGICTAGVCQAPTCTDSVKNGTETDADCGGPTCMACGLGQGCAVAADCHSGVCTGNMCRTCTVNSDCASGKTCSAGVCQ